jgi:uncharacterized LabA/DUF88 family protein
VDSGAVHIFWDNSNLFARAQDTCDDRKGRGLEPGHRLEARLSFPKIYDFASAGRVVEKAVAVGSVPPGLAALWDRLGDVGMIIDLQERGALSGKEQGVDQALKLEMMNSLVDRATPAVAVLVSGDGGFIDTVERMLGKGWGVEVMSFSNGFSPKLKKISTGHAGRGKYIELDPWYRQLVYLQGVEEGRPLRPSDELDLTDRPRV